MSVEDAFTMLFAKDYSSGLRPTMLFVNACHHQEETSELHITMKHLTAEASASLPNTNEIEGVLISTLVLNKAII